MLCCVVLCCVVLCCVVLCCVVLCCVVLCCVVLCCVVLCCVVFPEFRSGSCDLGLKIIIQRIAIINSDALFHIFSD